jgi:hypothetical protein
MATLAVVAKVVLIMWVLRMKPPPYPSALGADVTERNARDVPVNCGQGGLGSQKPTHLMRIKGSLAVRNAAAPTHGPRRRATDSCKAAWAE